MAKRKEEKELTPVESISRKIYKGIRKGSIKLNKDSMTEVDDEEMDFKHEYTSEKLATGAIVKVVHCRKVGGTNPRHFIQLIHNDTTQNFNGLYARKSLEYITSERKGRPNHLTEESIETCEKALDGIDL